MKGKAGPERKETGGEESEKNEEMVREGKVEERVGKEERTKRKGRPYIHIFGYATASSL